MPSHTLPTVDLPTMERALRRALAGEVRFGAGIRAAYSTDASNYRQVPLGVVVPRSAADVVAALAVCREHAAPVVCRGAGTSLAGQATNVAVVFDFSKHLNRVLDLDPTARLARVEPGCVLDALRAAAAPHGLTFGPDPATHDRCTLGGMIGNNSCGVHSVQAEFYGPGPLTAHSVAALEVATADGARFNAAALSPAEQAAAAGRPGRPGEIVAALGALAGEVAPRVRARFPDLPRRVSGFNLDALLPEHGFDLARALVGTEGTCATVLAATVRLIPALPARELVVLGYPDVIAAAAAVPEILAHRPVGLEGLDDRLVAALAEIPGLGGAAALLPAAGGVLLVEFGADDPRAAGEAADRFVASLGRAGAPRVRRLNDPAAMAAVWRLREAGLAAASQAAVRSGRPAWPGWEDAAVPPARLPAYLGEFRRLLDQYGYDGVLYGHFGHGCIHGRFDFDFSTGPGVARFRAFLDDAADLVVAHGGSLSGEHGDGQARGALLARMFGPELVAAFGRFKGIWDPEGRMNPGKVVDPRPPEADLRLGPEHRFAARAASSPARLAIAGGSGLAGPALACLGVGACRRARGGGMCPSFRALGDEEHSPRGRARLLFEMLRGEEVTGGWDDPDLHAALDLCLGCKACKRECPTGVDVAAVKAEFLSHHHERRARPRAVWAAAHLPAWTRAAAGAPRQVIALANRLAKTEPWAGWIRKAAGLAPGRALPELAPETFRAWFERRERRGREELGRAERAESASTAAPRHAERERGTWAGGARPDRFAGGQPAAARPVLLWPDCFTDAFRPEGGKAAVALLEAAGFAVSLPPTRLCCGRTYVEAGMLDRAGRAQEEALTALAPALVAGIPVVGLEPSCVAALRDELPALHPDSETARRLAGQSFLLGEFLDREGWRPPRREGRVLLHHHCHHKAVLDTAADAALLRAAGYQVEVLDVPCCGGAGAFGFRRETHALALACGELGFLPAVREASEETRIVADGFSCRLQAEHAAGRSPLTLAEILAPRWPAGCRSTAG